MPEKISLILSLKYYLADSKGIISACVKIPLGTPDD